jgi:hypothetical protein
MIDKLSEFVREMYLGVYSDIIISEMFTYVIDDSGKTNAQSGCHDDTVMATAIMLQLLLEGKGDTYIPEVVTDKKQYGTKDIVDPLFESDDNSEYSE